MDILEGTSTLGAPLWGGLTQSQRVAILSMYLHEVIATLANLEAEGEGEGEGEGASGEKWEVRSFARALLETRYSHLQADEGVGGAVSGLAAAIDRAGVRFTETTFVPDPPSEQIIKVVEHRVAQFAAWRRNLIRVEQGAWEMILMDYIEVSNPPPTSTIPPYSIHATVTSH